MTLSSSLQRLVVFFFMMLSACQDTGESSFKAGSQSFSADPGLDIVLSLESGSNLVEMLQGESKNLTTALNVVNESGTPIHVVNEVLIDPRTGGSP